LKMKMTKKQILKLLEELGNQLLQQGIEGEIGIVGGAAMVLAFDARVATKDVDAIFKPSEAIRKVVRKIAEENDLPADWLNNGVKGFLPRDPKRKIEMLTIPGLRVWVPEPEYMLAMKAISARFDTNDGDDLKLLIRKLNMSSSEEILKIVEKYYPSQELSAKVRFFVQELFESLNSEQDLAPSKMGPKLGRTKKPSVVSIRPDKTGEARIHPWRLCSAGEHWVRTHKENISPSKKHPKGSVTVRHAHCAKNPSGKDQLYPDEIREISKIHFDKVKERPCPNDLGFHGRGNKYDSLIAGWVKYWNDILSPKELLNPNLVKALLASESDFFAVKLAIKKNQNSGRGLMQILNVTRKILGDEKGELKQHFINVTRENLNDPSINICAGIRWLFHKRRLASSKLGREATWEEAIYEFKGGDTVPKKRSKVLMDRLFEKLEVLQKCGKE
jgi:predicted nucleotidyltransferase